MCHLHFSSQFFVFIFSWLIGPCVSIRRRSSDWPVSRSIRNKDSLWAPSPHVSGAPSSSEPRVRPPLTFFDQSQFSSWSGWGAEPEVKWEQPGGWNWGPKWPLWNVCTNEKHLLSGSSMAPPSLSEVADWLKIERMQVRLSSVLHRTFAVVQLALNGTVWFSSVMHVSAVTGHDATWRWN